MTHRLYYQNRILVSRSAGQTVIATLRVKSMFTDSPKHEYWIDG